MEIIRVRTHPNPSNRIIERYPTKFTHLLMRKDPSWQQIDVSFKTNDMQFRETRSRPVTKMTHL